MATQTTEQSAALLAHAHTLLAEAGRTDEPGERFRLAHLAALRIAAAAVAERGRPAGARRRLISVWLLLAKVAPEYDTWGRYFASAAPIRAAVEAGAQSAVSPLAAEAQWQAAAEFLAAVEGSIGVLAA